MNSGIGDCFDEIERYWKSEFIHYDKVYLKQFGLNSETSHFLETIGLMNGEKFIERSRVSFLSEFQIEIINNEKYVKIARGYGVGLYLKCETDEVYFFVFNDDTNIIKNSFCNTKLFNYVLFETVKSKIESNYEAVDDSEIEGYHCAREVIEEFKKIDQSAVYPYSYWANRMLNYAINYFYDEDEKFKISIRKGKYGLDEEAYFDALFNGMDVLETI